MRAIMTVAVLLTAPLVALSQAAVLDAPSAVKLVEAGGVLIDIRTSDELRRTGTPENAVHVPLQADDLTFNARFIDEVKSVAGNSDRPIAVIDANGKRAEYAARLLSSQGFADVLSVGEGIVGSNFGPGWIRRGLPMEKPSP